MATSGTFTSGRYGHSSYGPWLTLAWTQVSQSVANNTTTLDLTLRFHWDQDINYTVNNKKGSVQGNSYTYSGSFSGASGSRVLKTQRVTITHNSNGTKSVSLSGNITSLGIYWYSGGTTIGTMSVSGTANLETIPRASTLSKFSFNANLKNDTANKIKYTIDRKSDAFRHHIELRDGNTVVRTWDNQSSDGDAELPLTATEVNTLLNRMSTSTTKSYTLRVATRSGNNGGWIGSAVSRNATATVDDDVRPSVGAVTLSQTGNPITTHTLQGFSKIKASFTRSAGYGATISSSSIQVRRREGGTDSQTINSNDGTTTNPVSLHGVYEARGTARDSRGRTTDTGWYTITVTPYSAPTITIFSAVRNDSTPTTVNISRATTHTVLGTSNHLTYTIQRRQGTGAWTNVNTSATGSITTSGATGSATSTGNSVTLSYEFRLIVTDKLGGSSESLRSVSTQRVVLDIHKNEGVGIGKIHEQGVLDVDGDAFFKGPITITTESSDGNVTPITGQYLTTSTNGVLIDVCDTTLRNMITIRVTGNGYFEKPIFTILQAYHYETLGEFMQLRQTNFGEPLPRAWIFIQGGRVKIWLPGSGRYQSFIIEAWGQGGRIYTTKTQALNVRPTNVTHEQEFESFLPYKNNVNGRSMNDVLESGFYRGYTQTNSAQSTISGFLVINYSDDWLTQLQFVPGTNSDIYIRHKHRGNTWTSWTKK